jgi:hypothetical protein
MQREMAQPFESNDKEKPMEQGRRVDLVYLS